MNNERKFMIEIRVSFDGNMPEHEGYYTSPDMAKEAIDQLYELEEIENKEDNQWHQCLKINEGQNSGCQWLSNSIRCMNRGKCKYKC